MSPGPAITKNPRRIPRIARVHSRPLATALGDLRREHTDPRNAGSVPAVYFRVFRHPEGAAAGTVSEATGSS